MNCKKCWRFHSIPFNFLRTENTLDGNAFIWIYSSDLKCEDIKNVFNFNSLNLPNKSCRLSVSPLLSIWDMRENIWAYLVIEIRKPSIMTSLSWRLSVLILICPHRAWLQLCPQWLISILRDSVASSDLIISVGITVILSLICLKVLFFTRYIYLLCRYQ